MSRRPRKLTALEQEFKVHLEQQKLTAHTVEQYVYTVHRFLKHVGNERIDRISEAVTRGFFDGIRARNTKQGTAKVVSQFLNFAVARLPVPVTDRPPASAPKSKKELALRDTWNLERLLDQKNSDDDLIAKLARKLIDHYLYFQTRLKGGPENLDEVVRFADECRELIETNLPLFMTLSAQGRNVHSVIDERVQK